MGDSLVQRRRGANRRDSHTSPTLRGTNAIRGGYEDPAMGAREGSGDFGGQLRRHREAAGLSQEELAERAALTAKAISALETGRAPASLSPDGARPGGRTEPFRCRSLGADRGGPHPCPN